MYSIKNGYVYENGNFIKRTLFMDGERIVPGCSDKAVKDEWEAVKDERNAGKNTKDAESDSTCVYDAEGCYVIPGLVDVHTHGCAGYDACDGSEEALRNILRYEASCGVLAILPTTMTLSVERLSEICNTIKEYKRSSEERWVSGAEDISVESTIAGIHLEGPYINEKKAGAQNRKYLKDPDISDVRKLMDESSDLIRLITIAPELTGGMEFISEVSKVMRVSIGHTNADYDTARAAFDLGADHVTHTFNAMNPLLHRVPGVAGAAADCGAYAEIICDGNHLHPSTVRNAFRLFGKDRVVLISDSMMGTGLPDGEYQLGGQKVNKKGSLAALDDGTIAGSVSTLYQCMCNAVRYGIPLGDAVKAASENPAKSVGVDRDFGTLHAGSFANILVVDPDLTIRAVWNRGRRIG